LSNSFKKQLTGDRSINSLLHHHHEEKKGAFNTVKNKSDEKRIKITNKIGFKKLGGDTRNYQQLRSVNSNHSFTLKKFNQSSSGAI